MDYLKIRKLYHSAFTDEESKRRKARLKIYNDDFLSDLPDQVRNTVSNLRWDYGDQPWFEEAWEKYRKHVLDAGLGGKIKMPGFVFNEYIDRYVNEQEKKMKKELVHMESCNIEDLYHHGVKGQKWGVRRFQNEDGTLTEEGKVAFDKKVATAHLQVKALRSGDSKSAKAFRDMQNDIAKAERKLGIVSLNKCVSVGKNAVEYSVIYLNKKDYKTFIKESKKSVERGTKYLESLNLNVHSRVLNTNED